MTRRNFEIPALDFIILIFFTDESFNDYLWVVGGYEHEDLNSTEFVYTDKESAPGPTLDFIIAHHCMATLNENAIYIIGGKQDGEISNQVWIADPKNGFEIKKGPTLNEGRYFMSCGVYKDSDGVKKIVVAGGINATKNDTNTVEILWPYTSSDTWEFGKIFLYIHTYINISYTFL